jgi:Alpha-2,8-polysialyltransferase (POLYST)
MNCRTKVVILLTPLHLEMFKAVIKEYSIEWEKLLIYFSKHISKDLLIDTFGDSSIIFIEIPVGNISYINFTKQPLKTIVFVRKLIKKYELVLDNSLSKEIGEVFLGSDKDLFTQILVKKLKNSSCLFLVSALDEGIGYYKSNAAYDFLFRFLFSLFSKILFKYRLNYVSVLGKSRWINIIYARFPSKIKAKNKIILKASLPSKRIRSISSNKRVLILTSPLSEEQFMTPCKEVILYSKIISNYLREEFLIDIKQHPREELSKFKKFSNCQEISYVDAHLPAEFIDYSNYREVVNFGSSVVLDLIANGYPPDHIITYPISNKIKLPDLFNETDIRIVPSDIDG